MLPFLKIRVNLISSWAALSEKNISVNDNHTRIFKNNSGYERYDWVPGSNDAGWETADGSQDFYVNWGSNQPNSNRNDVCAVIKMGEGGTFSNINCQARLEFSCRIMKPTRGTCST